jgi:small subunit ribosomal protein S17
MNTRRRITGVVTSDKMMKTVVVEISRTYRHPLYKKVVHEHKRVKAHDEFGAKVGDQFRSLKAVPYPGISIGWWKRSFAMKYNWKKLSVGRTNP